MGTEEMRRKLVLGGSAAAWGPDASTFDYTTWEGTMGVAERLWVGSGHSPINVTSALPRLAVHSCRMKMRGYAVSPYAPSTEAMAGYTGWCTGGGPGIGGEAWNG